MQHSYQGKQTEYGKFYRSIDKERRAWILEHWGEQAIIDAFLMKLFRLPKVGETPDQLVSKKVFVETGRHEKPRKVTIYKDAYNVRSAIV